ncbi:MAG TPA: hypothetical protein VHZ24_10440 [Pirellulales bacterium]|jgi:hypothetical protein|nr:hypothetical protein [Pirellulales bacterium]
MDRLKLYWSQLKKHHFWLLCGLIVIISLTVWELSTRELRAKYEDNQRTIKSVYTQLQGLSDQSPNASYIKAVAGEENKIRQQVVKATVVAFDSQQKQLRWPKDVADVAKLKGTDEIPQALRDNYQNLVVRPELLRIFEKVRLRKEKKGGANPMGGNPMGGGAKVEYEGIVDWQAADRQRLSDRYQMISRPSTIRMRTTQEDFWAYEALVDIVLKLNQDATDPLNAVIKRINMMDVAQWATLHDQQNPGAELAGIENKDAEPAVMGMPGSESTLVRLPDQSSPTEGQRDPDSALLDGRYLDAENHPVPADAAYGYFRRVGGPSPPGSPPVGNPPFAEFKQMAVVMKFLMDQRKVPELLSACANSHLPIEVRQVLMRLIDTDSRDVQQNADHGERGPFDAEIEVRGIVYIYTEPDEKKLGTGSAPRPAQRSFGVPVPDTGPGPPAMPAMPPMQQF